MVTEILSRLNSNGSGLNLRELAITLVTAETAAATDIQLSRLEADELRLAALDLVRTQFSTLRQTVATIAAEPVLAVETSTASILPSVTDRNALQNGTVSFDVTSLAQRQVIEFAGFTAADLALETGSLTIDFGQWSGDPTPVFTADGTRTPVTLDITAGMTLQDLATQLTEVTGVTARVLTKGDGTFSLGIVSETGAQNAIRLTAAGTGGGGATLLAGFDTTTTNATRQVQAATNAQVVVDGIAISRTTNVLDDVLPGMTITLSAKVAGTITVGRDVNVADAALAGLVDGLNSTLALLRNVTNRGVNGGVRGDLAGDISIEGLENALRRVISSPLNGFSNRPIYLADLGVATQRDGTLFFDRTVFDRAFATGATDFDAVLGDNLISVTDGVRAGGFPSSALASGDLKFVVRPDGSATLDGWGLTRTDNGDGSFTYGATDGPVRGLTVTADAGVTEGTIRFGRSFVAQIARLLETAGSGNGAIGAREREIDRSSDAANDRLAQIEARAAILEKRYLARFTAMEQIVTQMKSTGSYLSNLVDQWNSDR